MTPIRDLNDLSLALHRIATCARMVAEGAHNYAVTSETEYGDELLFLVDALEAQTCELAEGFSKIQINGREIRQP